MLGIEVQVVAGNAFIDDQNDIVADRFGIAPQADRLTRAHGIMGSLVGEQTQIGQRRIHDRQPPGTFTATQEENA
ncbi:hypothetical protein D3C85_715210 [compost metagenome]